MHDFVAIGFHKIRLSSISRVTLGVTPNGDYRSVDIYCALSDSPLTVKSTFAGFGAALALYRSIEAVDPKSPADLDAEHSALVASFDRELAAKEGGGL